MTPFGRKIRALRRAQGVSQKQMAVDLGISPAYLSALEHGHRGQPSWALVQRIIPYFNLIWDDAEEIEHLARSSHPRLVIDASGLDAEAVALVNDLARKIRQLSPTEITALAAILKKVDR